MEYIKNNNNEIIKNVLRKEKYNEYINIIDLLSDLNDMYRLFGIKEAKQVVIDKVDCGRDTAIKRWDLPKMAQTLSKALEKATHDIRRHYYSKVIGALFELYIENKGIEEATRNMDKNGWDFIDKKNKVLIQAKVGTDLKLVGNKKKIKWAEKNGYEEYGLQVVWFNLNTLKTTKIKLKDAKGAEEQNDNNK